MTVSDEDWAKLTETAVREIAVPANDMTITNVFCSDGKYRTFRRHSKSSAYGFVRVSEHGIQRSVSGKVEYRYDMPIFVVTPGSAYDNLLPLTNQQLLENAVNGLLEACAQNNMDINIRELRALITPRAPKAAQGPPPTD